MKKMKKMKKMKNLLFLSVLAIFLHSCSKDSTDPINRGGLYEGGYFITNEGNFGTGNGSITYVSPSGDVQQNVFESNNSFLLGDVVQSMSIINDKVYIVVNNSSKIEVASRDSMKYEYTLSVNSPRIIHQVNENKAYISSWGDNMVYILDLNSGSISGSINCGNGPESIFSNGEYAYVCNNGGWSFDNTVSVIDISTDNVVSTINVGDKPNSIVEDLNGNVWVLSGGYTQYDPVDWSIISQTQGSLVKIVNNSVESKIDFPLGTNVSNLVINETKDMLYFSSNSSVVAHSVYSDNLSSDVFIDKGFYSLASNDGYIYCSDAKDFVQQGWSYTYDEIGNLLDSVQTGIIPGSYCFN